MREEERKKKEECVDRNRSPSTIARTGTSCYSRTWKPLTPTFDNDELIFSSATRDNIRLKKEQQAHKRDTKLFADPCVRLSGSNVGETSLLMVQDTMEGVTTL